MQHQPHHEPIDVAKVLKFAVDKHASDVILTSGTPPAVRLKGELILTNQPALKPETVKKLVYGILTDRQIAEVEQKKELDFSLMLDGRHRFRVNVYFQRQAVGAAFRIIPDHIPKLDTLGLPPFVADLALRPQGLVLVTGPTGHGKSTTQAAMIDLINENRRVHIVTIEDPIEFVHKSKKSIIDQREVGTDTLSFAEALRHVLRQDPDVILVGEMRDLETVSTALTAAETGHLVVATLHTNDAVQSVDRVIDMFPPYQQSQVRSQLSMCLLSVIAQRLLPREDQQGLVLACELMYNNAAVANLIRDGKTQNIYGIMETHAKAGMFTMDYSIKNLYAHGTISREVAATRMRNPKLLEIL
jgi:twitching motility protein PilT